MFTILEKYTQKLIAFFIGIFSILVLVFMFSLIIVWPIWEWEPFAPSNIKTMRFSEKVISDGNIYQKNNTFQFIIDENNNRVYQQLITPIFNDSDFNKYYFNSVDDFSIDVETNKLVNKKINNLPKIKSIQHLFTKLNNSLIEIKNCVVVSEEDWICEDTLKFTKANGSFQKFGMIDGDWVIDIGLKKSLYKTKLNWFLDNRSCGDSCFIMTETEAAQREIEAQERMEELRIKTQDP